jgi:membrane protein implicated in regulation of membrane protease activity
MPREVPSPLTEALGGVAAALAALALGAPWWLLVGTYLVAAGAVALAVEHLRHQRDPTPRPPTLLPRH